LIQPTVLTTSHPLRIVRDGRVLATIRAVPYSRTKCRFYFDWLDETLTAVTDKERRNERKNV